MEKNFLNVHSKKDIVLIVSLIIAGAICLLLPLGSYAHIISFLLITLGVFLAFVMKSEYKEVSSGVRRRSSATSFSVLPKPMLPVITRRMLPSSGRPRRRRASRRSVLCVNSSDTGMPMLTRRSSGMPAATYCSLRSS